MLNFLWYVIIGFVVGLLARAVLPGSDRMGLIATTVVGIVGGLIGGYLAGKFARGEVNPTFHPAGFLWSVIGAVVLLLLLRLLR